MPLNQQWWSQRWALDPVDGVQDPKQYRLRNLWDSKFTAYANNSEDVNSAAVVVHELVRKLVEYALGIGKRRVQHLPSAKLLDWAILDRGQQQRCCSGRSKTGRKLKLMTLNRHGGASKWVLEVVS
jgi:hypothetical protein